MSGLEFFLGLTTIINIVFPIDAAACDGGRRGHVGIFSFIGKKGEPEPDDSDKDTARRKPPGNSRVGTPARPSRDAALATARKIDAIESEMTSELARPIKKSGAPTPSPAAAATVAAGKTLPPMGMSTDFLLGSEHASGSVEVSSSETPAIIEEAAILFANEQYEMVEQVLLAATHDPSLGDALRGTWLMLFDLYQILGNKAQFEHHSIEYAAKFETSPPAWHGAESDEPAAPKSSGGTPALTFSGKLDESIVKQLERTQKMSNKAMLRLEFSRVTEVLPVGCELLLAALKKLQKAGHEFVLVGAPELANKIRAIIEVGRRDESEAPWLLLLEILQMLNRETEFEEASIDYCVTYEVSPPAFIAPKNKVSTAVEEPDAAGDDAGKFMMPAVIDGRSNALTDINEYATSHNPIILDCARLNRVDFSAAGQLLSSLAPLAAKGKAMELQHVNHLVAALLQVMGVGEVAKIHLRKS